LLITAETYSKYININDKSVRTIFGDGAAATLISSVENISNAIGPFVFGTDGRGARNLIVPAGGMRLPRSSDTAIEHEDGNGNIRSNDNLYMAGPEIFTFTLASVPRAVTDLLIKARLNLDDIDLFVFHQANKFMIETLRVKCKIPAEKFVFEMEDIGNTVSATIPIALKRVIDAGRVRAGMKILIAGFGVGYSWSAAIVNL
jgi:3-oxoacyl-[acyl-carrier-protein] synthase-3